MKNDLDLTVTKLADDEFLLGEFSKIDVESKYESQMFGFFKQTHS